MNPQPPQPGNHPAPMPGGFEAPPQSTPPPLPGSETPAEFTYTPITDDMQAAEPNRGGLYLFIGCLVLGVIGMVIWAVTPDKTEAKEDAAEPNYAQMTNRELAEDGGVLAAHELADRMVNGGPGQNIEVSDAVRRYGSPRLARNLAQQLAIEQQKRQTRMMVEMERENRPVYEGVR